MEKSITIPTPVWGRLATEADLRGVSIADLLVATVQHLVKPPTTEAERIVFLARSGFTDRQICEQLGVTREKVSRVRLKAGVPAAKGRKTA